ncbi:hypothetical protein JHK84_035658 [Glycine max]|nr:hypothetical protein JHK86_035374 [Glycine max]KAG5129261.1 hypothetical protein JHK84_035658 [Glycine max]
MVFITYCPASRCVVGKPYVAISVEGVLYQHIYIAQKLLIALFARSRMMFLDDGGRPPNRSTTGARKDVRHIRILGVGWWGWHCVLVAWKTSVFLQVATEGSATSIKNGVRCGNKERGMGMQTSHVVGFVERAERAYLLA